MKANRTVCINTETLEKVARLKLNVSAVCQEALDLACMEPGDSTSEELATSKMLKYKIEKNQELTELRRLALSETKSGREKLHEKLRAFSQKYSLTLAEAVNQLQNSGSTGGGGKANQFKQVAPLGGT